MKTCKECLHYEACKAFNRMRQNVIDASSSGAEKLCGRFADKSRFIELPCKVGDTVYRISKRYGKWEVLPREVEGVGHFGDLNGETKWLIFSTTGDWLGDTVFVAEEEAKAEVNRRNNG